MSYATVSKQTLIHVLTQNIESILRSRGLENLKHERAMKIPVKTLIQKIFRIQIKDTYSLEEHKKERSIYQQPRKWEESTGEFFYPSIKAWGTLGYLCDLLELAMISKDNTLQISSGDVSRCQLEFEDFFKDSESTPIYSEEILRKLIEADELVDEITWQRFEKWIKKPS